eukprot:CAMPEP_0169427074 /NCGR_PEP_ID=MMETSP1042-20121227/571_1 /TAXON_ID=464988 /ORGANISM="Hemiselmis andersenii, Strain CCMP1180" /LENGTH=96 /DNA_ID=CAMNT_0009537097 /DNA_START=312 /DNA_END=602 /DNA_ORIENTATION=+
MSDDSEDPPPVSAGSIQSSWSPAVPGYVPAAAATERLAFWAAPGSVFATMLAAANPSRGYAGDEKCVVAEGSHTSLPEQMDWNLRMLQHEYASTLK